LDLLFSVLIRQKWYIRTGRIAPGMPFCTGYCLYLSGLWHGLTFEPQAFNRYSTKKKL